jgi:enoyl-CoA hydratase
MSEDILLEQRDGPIATLLINRPKSYNALNLDVADKIHAAITRLAEDGTIRVIILSGVGEKAFAAGADITQFLTATPADAEKLARRMQDMHAGMRKCPKPIVAAINGHCLGGGFELALACDIRIAAENARFGLPEINLAVLPGGGGTIRLAQTIGPALARAMILTGEIIDAQRAFSIGIVSAVHPIDHLREAARAAAGKLANLSPFALAQIKAILDVSATADVETASVAEAKAFALCFSTEDQKEGARAFLEKRKAVFTGY